MNTGTSPGAGTRVVSRLGIQLPLGGVLFFGPALLLAVFTAAGAPAHWQIAALLVILGTLFLVLGERSRLVADEERITVCFFGLRSSSVAWRDVVAATYFMSLPSSSFAVTLRTRSGQRLLVHWYWWRREHEIARLMARQLLRYGAAFDEVTASIVSRELHVPPPPATLAHVPWKTSVPAYVAAHPGRATARTLAVGVVDTIELSR
ncbi:MAG: hypothetical protein ACP5VP_06040 [Candidatus Limnocylindrales bacterium]